ncbi:MAG: PEP-CTERM sorting domain-containing protein [Opitutales bacterium]|nr:PEP-CTERM sorting domain-containing protein [Opitutales bacterium]
MVVVPEPSTTAALMGVAGLLALLYRRRHCR